MRHFRNWVQCSRSCVVGICPWYAVYFFASIYEFIVIRLHHHRSHSILLFICGICVYDFFFILFAYMCRNISSSNGKNREETFHHFHTVVCRCRHGFCLILFHLLAQWVFSSLLNVNSLPLFYSTRTAVRFIQFFLAILCQRCKEKGEEEEEEAENQSKRRAQTQYCYVAIMYEIAGDICSEFCEDLRFSVYRWLFHMYVYWLRSWKIKPSYKFLPKCEILQHNDA